MNRSRFRLGTPATVAGLVTILLLLSAPVWAQTPSWQDPQGILEWLKLQAMGVTFVVSLVWKYLPVVKDFSNRLIPWLALATYLVVQLAGPAAVQAGELGPVLAKPSFAHAAAIAVVNSAIGKALWDGWLKPSLGSWFDRVLMRVPQTP